MHNIETNRYESIEELFKLPIDQLSKKDESHYLEFKSSLRWDYKNSKMSEDIGLSAIRGIAAFMNSAGGILVIGVGDDNSIVGLQSDFETFNNKKNWDTWCQHLNSLIYSKYGIHKKFSDNIKIKKQMSNDNSIAVIKVQASSKPVWIKVNNNYIFVIRTHNSTSCLDGKVASEYISSHWHNRDSQNVDRIL